VVITLNTSALGSVCPCPLAECISAYQDGRGITAIAMATAFLRATAGTAIARLSHRNSVRPSVRHTGGSGKNSAS